MADKVLSHEETIAKMRARYGDKIKQFILEMRACGADGIVVMLAEVRPDNEGILFQPVISPGAVNAGTLMAGTAETLYRILQMDPDDAIAEISAPTLLQ